MLNKTMIYLYYLVLVVIVQLPAQETTSSGTVVSQKGIDTKKMGKAFQFLARASEPTRFYFAPTSRILRSLEVVVMTGGFFGVEENGDLFNQVGIGLGNIAEIEFSSSNISNKLTGDAGTIPTSVFKVSLIPESLSHRWYIPQMAVQLRSTPWKSVARERSNLLPQNKESHDGISLRHLNLNSRFTTLYLVLGKDGSIGGIHIGYSLSDVRTKETFLYLYDEINFGYYYLPAPAMKKEVQAPFGGLYLRANPQTWLMAEIEPIPLFEYDVPNRTIHIRRAWLGIGGIRFFIGRWLSLDAGVKYQSDYDGIADAEINIGVNVVVPFKNSATTQVFNQ